RACEDEKESFSKLPAQLDIRYISYISYIRYNLASRAPRMRRREGKLLEASRAAR
mgnify:CR=1